jgi:tetratricopeptide (TPR) repeat protein
VPPDRARIAVSALLLAVAVGARAADADYSAALDKLWDFDAPAVSEQRFRAERDRFAAHTREALEAATQIARALSLQRRFGQADATLDEVARDLDAAPARIRVRYLLERGRTRNSSGEPAKAVPMFMDALRASDADTLGGAAFYRIDALHMLGIAAPADARIEWDRKALAAAEAASDERARGWRGSLLHNLGWAEHDRGNFAAALDCWQRVLALREAAGDAGGIRIAKWTVARGLRSLGRLDEAEAIQHALATETDRAQASDGYIYEELAEIALARNDAASARRFAAKAHALLKDDADLAANDADRLARLARIGGVAP